MSVFGGDSWARESQQRKRRLDDLMLPTAATSSSSSPSASDSFKRVSSGKFACLVCPHRPVLESSLMLSMHIKGSRHTAESVLREKELSRQEEINKRLALSSVASISKYSSNQHPSVRAGDTKEKPLTAQTRRAILEAQSTRFNNFSATQESHDMKRTGNALSHCSQVTPCIPFENFTGNTGSVESTYIGGGAFTCDEKPSKVLSEWQVDIKKRQEQELRFTASGWKWDCHGKWYRDENVEFDSDEDDPNTRLG